MEAVIDQSLGDVQRTGALSLLARPGKDHLVHADAVVRQVVVVLQLGAQVVGVEHRVVGNCFQAGVAVGTDIGVGANQVAEIAQVRVDLADRLRAIPLPPIPPVPITFDGGDREIADKLFGAAERPRAGPAAAVRGGERLVQVQVHHVDSQIGGPHPAQHCVHVGPVAVDQGADFVGGPAHLADPGLEYSQRVGHGHHEPGDRFVQLFHQDVEIDLAVGI